ncbi:PD-(D/E)XK nuclease family protein [Pseudarthrobacter sp. MDT3-28]|uniref:PD-(D/E)XK nuclease family protein n=1 Tax=Pseudarthrobacter raffinosi TaxID=2953651 RepID=UPI00208F9199|nr:PD-(D/E)XK nuclease family protein [Pseudarthrobacter sp. MDT3-28]MCO4236906.1 PD-(D/E)XK nuclease family protein [Pseudarthrobacter sp. MDT3-28]
MKTEFGWHLDRAPWAYTRPGLNRIRVGRKNFTALLQTRLGITRPETGHAERVSQYLERLQTIDTPDAWFHESFKVDPWSTAQELLAARDDAVSNGWDGLLPAQGPDSEATSPLLQTLSAAENAPGRLSPSLADDIAELLTAIDSPLPLGIDELILQHPEHSFPQVWQVIIGKLRARGVHISEACAAATPPTLTILTAETEWDAAEAAARWLASGDNASTAVVCSDSSALLDSYLSGHGLPALGAAAPSVWRPQDQLIPLFFEVIWSPVNVHLLAELLSLPGSPVRRGAARHLLGALKAEPGIGGDAWIAAIADIEGDEHLGRDIARMLDDVFNTGLLIEERDVSGIQLAERAEWLAARLHARAAIDETAKATASLLQRILALIKPLPRVSRRDLRRIIAAVITPSSGSLVSAEASPWLRLGQLAELNDEVDHVLWWGFQGASAQHNRRWDAHDVAALAQAGVLMPAPEELSALEVTQTLAASTRTRNLVLVQIQQRNGERVAGNPLLEALVDAQPTGQAVSVAARLAALTVGPEQLTDDVGRWSLAGRHAQLAPVPKQRPTAPVPLHEVAPNPALVPKRISYSQLSTLLGCSFAWALKHKAHLRVPDAAGVPAGNQMLGIFAHKVVEVLHGELRPLHRSVPEAAEVSAAVGRLLPQLASELLLPGQLHRLAGVRATIEATVMMFFQQLQRGGVVLQDMEKEFSKDLTLTVGGSQLTVSVAGRADAVGIDAQGRTSVVDLKWSNTEKYLREDVQRGEALQLALYQWALNDTDVPPDFPAAYFLLKQGTFASAHPEFGAALQPVQDTPELWRRAVRAVEFTVEEVLAGRITATQPAENALAEDEPTAAAIAAENQRLHRKPNCRYCDFGTLCGLKGDYS